MSRGYNEKMNKHYPKWIRVVASILAAILIWPLVLILIVNIIWLAMTIGLISTIAYYLYNKSLEQ